MPSLVTNVLPNSKDADNVPRPVVAYTARRASQDWEYERHEHRKSQLLYSVRGVLNCEVEDGMWIVPPLCAVWIPGGLPHSAHGSGETECYCIFVETDAAPNLPQVCCTIAVSPLLRELLMKAVGFPERYPLGGREDRLVATLLDELAAAPVEDLHLPMPRDSRLTRLVNMLLTDPSEKTSMSAWASRIGMSERSLSRLLIEELGVSFGRWRRQLHVILALQRMTQGDSVQTVALELGYENASGFVTMFRKAVGKPPARYLLDRKTQHGSAGNTPQIPGIVLSGPSQY